MNKLEQAKKLYQEFLKAEEETAKLGNKLSALVAGMNSTEQANYYDWHRDFRQKRRERTK